jgi:hypothetical protein
MAFGITDSKSILTSKTFYGALLSLSSVLFPSFYLHLMTAIGINDPAQIADKLVAVVGALYTIYGRFAATQPVTLTGAPAVVYTNESVPTEPVVTTNPDSTTIRKMAIIETKTTIIPVDNDQEKQNKVEPINTPS